MKGSGRVIIIEIILQKAEGWGTRARSKVVNDICEETWTQTRRIGCELHVNQQAGGNLSILSVPWQKIQFTLRKVCISIHM